MLWLSPMDAAFERRKRYGIWVGLVVSLVLHLALIVGLSTVEPPKRPKKEAVSLRVLSSKPQAQRAEKLSGQVIDIPAPAREEVPSPTARFLSKYNTRVEQEQRAKVRRAEKKGGTVQGSAGLTKGEPAKQAGEKSKKWLGDGKVDGRMALLRRGGDGQFGGEGIGGLRGMLGEVLGFGGGSGEKGGGGSDDPIFGVDKEGEETLVNSRSFKYWDFFQRVKERVRQEWDPVSVYRARDPTGSVYGIRDRLTILEVVLDKEGHLLRLEVVRPSGLAFLDEEAVRAFREAAPFPNPPAGLEDESGRIQFHFGFLLDMTSSRTRFFWQRP